MKKDDEFEGAKSETAEYKINPDEDIDKEVLNLYELKPASHYIRKSKDDITDVKKKVGATKRATTKLLTKGHDNELVNQYEGKGMTQ